MTHRIEEKLVGSEQAMIKAFLALNNRNIQLGDEVLEGGRPSMFTNEDDYFDTAGLTFYREDGIYRFRRTPGVGRFLAYRRKFDVLSESDFEYQFRGDEFMQLQPGSIDVIPANRARKFVKDLSIQNGKKGNLERMLHVTTDRIALPATYRDDEFTILLDAPVYTHPVTGAYGTDYEIEVIPGEETSSMANKELAIQLLLAFNLRRGTESKYQRGIKLVRKDLLNP